ncbi:MAG: hypothetical protein R2795_15910 [Saprospiraceae bacterium]
MKFELLILNHLRLLFMLFIIFINSCKEQPISYSEQIREIAHDSTYFDYGIYPDIIPIDIKHLSHQSDILRISHVSKYDTSYVYTIIKKAVNNPPGRNIYKIKKEMIVNQSAISFTRFLDEQSTPISKYIWFFFREYPIKSDIDKMKDETYSSNLGMYDYVIFESRISEHYLIKTVSINQENSQNLRIIRTRLDKLYEDVNITGTW